MELSDLTGTKAVLSLGGRSLIMRQMTLADIGLVREWLKANLPDPMIEAKKALAAIRPGRRPIAPTPPDANAPADAHALHGKLMAQYEEDVRQWSYEKEEYDLARNKIVDQAIAQQEAGMDRAAAAALVASPQGIALHVWLCVRHEHPDVTKEWVEEALKSADLLEIKRVFDFVNQIPEELSKRTGETFEGFTGR